MAPPPEGVWRAVGDHCAEVEWKILGRLYERAGIRRPSDAQWTRAIGDSWGRLVVAAIESSEGDIDLDLQRADDEQQNSPVCLDIRAIGSRMVSRERMVDSMKVAIRRFNPFWAEFVDVALESRLTRCSFKTHHLQPPSLCSMTYFAEPYRSAIRLESMRRFDDLDIEELANGVLLSVSSNPIETFEDRRMAIERALGLKELQMQSLFSN